jgi:hypothetical protein
MKNGTQFRISGLPIDLFNRYFGMSDTELAEHHAQRVVADSRPGYPCRVSLVDAEPGEALILLPFLHHDVQGPYRSSGPIYVRETAQEAQLEINEIPEVAKTRLMSVRAYSKNGLLQASAVAEREALVVLIREFLSDENIAYLHLHNAKPGCYSCRVDRA